LSKGSRGPADIIATYGDYTKWLIQVKSSTGIANLKGYELKRLKEASKVKGGLAVIATLQPTETVLSSSRINHLNCNIPMMETGWGDDRTKDVIYLGNYLIIFYSLNDWNRIVP
jgi:hypothetical protein